MYYGAFVIAMFVIVSTVLLVALLCYVICQSANEIRIAVDG
jgi:pilus assembly protein TadC